MNVLKRLMTAVRAGANEIGEAIVDNQAFRIFEQEIIDAKEELKLAEQSLANIVAQKISMQKEIDEISKDIGQNESYALKALEQNKESLALEVAEKITVLEKQKDSNKQILSGLENQISRLKKSTVQAKNNIQALERELKLVETTQRIQKANEMVAKDSNTSSSIQYAKDSLERIKERQQYKEDLAEAKAQLADQQNSENLDAKLKDAGIIVEKHNANEVLQRIKQKNNH